jgi:hypothetical protein
MQSWFESDKDKIARLERELGKVKLRMEHDSEMLMVRASIAVCV